MLFIAFASPRPLCHLARTSFDLRLRQIPPPASLSASPRTTTTWTGPFHQLRNNLLQLLKTIGSFQILAFPPVEASSPLKELHRAPFRSPAPWSSCRFLVSQVASQSPAASAQRSSQLPASQTAVCQQKPRSHKAFPSLFLHPSCNSSILLNHIRTNYLRLPSLSHTNKRTLPPLGTTYLSPGISNCCLTYSFVFFTSRIPRIPRVHSHGKCKSGQCHSQVRPFFCYCACVNEVSVGSARRFVEE